MINSDQVVDLLTVAATYDNRKPNPDSVLAWGEAAARGRWTFEAAVEAIHEHYAASTEFLMPGHIRAILANQRTLPPHVPSQRDLDNHDGWHRPALTAGDGPNPSGPPADLARVSTVIAQVADELGWTREVDHRAVIAEHCDYCGSHPGEDCTRLSHRTGTGRTPCAPHPTRRERAIARQKTQET